MPKRLAGRMPAILEEQALFSTSVKDRVLQEAKIEHHLENKAKVSAN